MKSEKPRMVVEPRAGGVYIDGVLQEKPEMDPLLRACGLIATTKVKPKKELNDDSGK